MKNFIIYNTLLALFAVSRIAMADMQIMTEEELQAIDGQAGVDISLKMSLNQNLDYSFNTVLCSDVKFCRFAISINNRYDNGAYVDSNGLIRDSTGVLGGALGKKYWFVFKQIQGTLNFQEIKLDGADLPAYLGDNGTTVQKAAIRLGFDAKKLIWIRNFGYESLAIERDTVDNEGNGNLPGYLATGMYITSGFDNGKEIGFTGLNIHGNLALKATLQIFSCDANHPRC